MSTTVKVQLEAIRSMMASGHRSVHMERHTLLLWGLAAAFLIFVTDEIFSHARFPDRHDRALWANAFVAAVLFAVGLIDYRLTRRARAARHETISFVQMQLTKVWWLLVGLIVVISVGTNLFGGGYLFYGIVLALMGLAFYIHGLFSQQMLSWIGVLMLALGLVAVALNVPFALLEWLAFFVFGLGFPFLALVIDKAEHNGNFVRRLLVAGAWLALVIAPTAAMYQRDTQSADPEGPLVMLDNYVSGDTADGVQIVRLPAGTLVPVNIALDGDVLAGTTSTILPIRLAEPIDLVVNKGELDGRFRVGEGNWKRKMYNLRVQPSEVTATLTPQEGPQVEFKVQMTTSNR
jgi:hypothetical protein